MHYRFASVHIAQNLLCYFSHPPAFTRLPVRANYKGLTHHSIMAQVCATVAAIGMNQPVWLYQPCPFPPASYPALFSSFLDATCLPSLLLPESPATGGVAHQSSLPVVFSVFLQVPFPCQCCPPHFAGIQHFTASSELHLFVIIFARLS